MFLGVLFKEYSSTGKKASRPQGAMKTDKSNMNDQGNKPCEQHECLYILGMLNSIAHSHHNVSSALSCDSTKNSNPTRRGFNILLLVVDY